MRFHELAASIILALYSNRPSTGTFRAHSELRQMPWYTHDRGWWQ